MCVSVHTLECNHPSPGDPLPHCRSPTTATRSDTARFIFTTPTVDHRAPLKPDLNSPHQLVRFFFLVCFLNGVGRKLWCSVQTKQPSGSWGELLVAEFFVSRLNCAGPNAFQFSFNHREIWPEDPKKTYDCAGQNVLYASITACSEDPKQSSLSMKRRNFSTRMGVRVNVTSSLILQLLDKRFLVQSPPILPLVRKCLWQNTGPALSA